MLKFALLFTIVSTVAQACSVEDAVYVNSGNPALTLQFVRAESMNIKNEPWEGDAVAVLRSERSKKAYLFRLGVTQETTLISADPSDEISTEVVAIMDGYEEGKIESLRDRAPRLLIMSGIRYDVKEKGEIVPSSVWSRRCARR